MRDQLLDPFDVRRAVLTYGDVLFGLNRLRNPYFAMEVMRAANEWTHDQWLSRDNRLVGTILIANHIPELAAKEIRRASADRRFRAVLICGNAIGQPLGHPIYHPIYEAAAEAGLPLAIHGGGEGPTYPAAAGGFLNFYLEFHALRFQPVATDVVSLILNGVFDKYPALRILLMEAGVSWIPGVFWRLDEDYKGLRREIPWLKKLPSEYFSEHFRLTTQPLDVSPQREGLIDLLRSCGGDDLLVYSSDYPHWDADEVDYVATRLPKDWLPGVFWKNAADFFGWEESVFSDAVSDTASHLRAERE
jgi:predicted TIM-barrel fold metal-dependent hydrolase